MTSRYLLEKYAAHHVLKFKAKGKYFEFCDSKECVTCKILDECLEASNYHTPRVTQDELNQFKINYPEYCL